MMGDLPAHLSMRVVDGHPGTIALGRPISGRAHICGSGLFLSIAEIVQAAAHSIRGRGSLARKEQVMDKLEKLHDRLDELEAALQRIVQWSEAYPLDIFPRPDYPRARAVLEANGRTPSARTACGMS